MSKKKEKNALEQEKTDKDIEQGTQADENAQSKEKEQTEAEKLQEELTAQKESLLRLAAEYDNYRKRTTAEKAGIYSDATAAAVKELLVVADSLDMAVKSAENAPDEYKKGLELMANQLEAVLVKLNVESFGRVGDEFNPDLHNAVSKIEDGSMEENVLAVVFQKGYKVGDKIIRHAMVQVANCD